MNNILEQLIDLHFIFDYYKDLSHMSKTHVIQHYNSTGKKEGRILSNLHIQQILRNRYFNIGFYKSHYNDVKDMSPSDIINQYIQFGQQEGRIVSNKHAASLTNTPDFDIDFYKAHHIDLHNMNPEQLVHHYISYGKQEGRLVINEHNIAPYNIISISHIMGGGTQTYINNIAKMHNINYEISVPLVIVIGTTILDP